MIVPVTPVETMSSEPPDAASAATWSGDPQSSAPALGLLRFGLETKSLEAASAADFALRRLPGARIAMGSHGAGDVASGAPPASFDTIVLAVVLRGRARAVQLGRDEHITQGGAILMTTCDVGTYTLRDNGRHLTVQLDRAELTPRVPDLAARLMRAFRPDGDALQHLVSHARAAIDLDAGAAPQLQRHVTSQLCDLVAFVAGGPASTDQSPSGIRAERLRAIKAEIDGRLGDTNLSAESLALSQRISPDYVRKLFRDAGSSLSGHLLASRLAFAHAALSDPARSGHRIAAIAFEAGFSDLSHFNRCFRRRYAMSPSEIRGRARRDPA